MKVPVLPASVADPDLKIRIIPWIRIRFSIKVALDPESGSVSNYTDPDPTKTIEN